MANLRPWFRVVDPRHDLKENRPLDASEFAVHLDQIREGRAREDYQKPERFFERTYMTKTLKDLAVQVVRRLSGQSVETSAVFNMATQFGGGKTHALALLYHLAQGGPASGEWSGVRDVLKQAQVAGVPKANLAVFVGQQFDPIRGRGADSGEPVRKTPWAEIAWQLGGVKSLKVVAEHDERGIAPGGDAIRAFLPEGPCLILMDEVLNYMSRFRKSGTGEGSQFYNFLQNLSEEARLRSDVVLAVSIPKSETTEMTEDDQHDYQMLKHVLDRLGKAVIMSAETETSEIIRRRLFDWGGIPDEGKKTVAAFTDWAIAHKTQLGAFDVETARERFLSSYPFHPALLTVFERKWQSLPRFQKTRGMLRLLALWVSDSYERGYKGTHSDPLIGLGTAPLDNAYFRPALFEELGTSELEGPVTTDISGQKDAHAIRLDREADNSVKKSRLHQKVATVIFFESNGGQTRDVATLPEIRVAVGEPDLDIGHVESVLDALVESCHYLAPVGNAYKFSPVPNLNKMLIDRRATITAKKVEDRVRQIVLDVFKGGWPSIERSPFPEKTGQVSDRPGLTLVILSPEQEAKKAETRSFVEQVIQNHGQSGRTFKSGLIFVAPSSTRLLREAATKAIAWEEIADDTEAQKRLDEGQKSQIDKGLRDSGRDLKEAVWKTYNQLLFLGKENQVRDDITLGAVLPSSASSLVDYIIVRLREKDEVTDSVGVGKLLKAWPSGFPEWTTQAARNAFFSSPILPRLLKPETLGATIADGVNQGQFAYAEKFEEGRYGDIFLKPETGLRDGDIKISDDTVLLTTSRAKELIQPPHLARVEITPSIARLKPKETVTFSVECYDQHDRAFDCPAVAWSCSGGTIDARGRFTAEVTGTFRVEAIVNEFRASATVEVAESIAPPPPPPKKGFAWKGAVPPQKWMNFYTKVLSRFASNSGLRLVVSFEVPPGEEIDQAKIDEAKTAIQELGLSEDVEVQSR